MREAREQRSAWKQAGVPMEERRPLLLQALNRLYAGEGAADAAEAAAPAGRTGGPR
jgi:hypothetical protein